MSDGPPPAAAETANALPKMSAASPAFNPNAFAFKPRNLPSGAGGGTPAPPPGAPPGGPGAGGAPAFFERPAPASGGVKKELVIGGAAPKKKEFVIGGPAPSPSAVDSGGEPKFFERSAPTGGPKKELVIGGAPKKAELVISGPTPKKKEFVIGAPVVVKKEEEVAAAVAVPEKELEKLAVSDTKKEEKKATKEEKKVMEEQAVEEEEDTTYDSREHLNLVFIGHVDAGKSTIGGQILLQAGMVDDRTIEKYKLDAKEKNRESWYMAYIMDTSEEERAKGKTVEVGRAHFETTKKRYTVLDAPGHKNYVPNMIAGAAQADVGVLVIAARKGEFETGFERGGQTREHAQLAKTLGVTKLIVLVNKMDDPTVEWDKARWDEINTKISPFLKSCGYNVARDVQYVPVSGLYGTNMKTRVDKSVCDWYTGKSFFETLDDLDHMERNPDAPFRMPVLDKHKDMGTIVMGKTEAGTVRRGDKLVVMPNNVKVTVAALFRDDVETTKIMPGENVRLRLTGIEEDQLQSGFVLCAPNAPVHVTQEIECQLAILELLEHKTLFTAGYKAVIHIHAVTEECEVVKIVHEIDGKTRKPKEKKKGAPVFLKSGSLATVRIKTSGIICCEKYADVPSLGRFTLRDEGRTIAIGKVLKLKPYEGINQM
mmetsp:Transcript_232/g.746  ORF Transcript_232/g.746 Transcript_232/m.746 type:complete len:654 (+) Transcript_232:46-2007(+)|eukprot:CAMPEP_0197132692 /NCGR_PEP_ID=MMETSP1390-20130617/24775_1 /TAXON_ID=38833 /ORGANISM="Micromonas sp., Strain CCMP2099" /LENGTH=653 /DNA_ID=CAMNT_0042575345 /DNA_START=45 /DNA_END=2006 /DNA_ORIENTATION=+